MSLLSKDQILSAEDRKYETLPVPEWNGEVRLRSLSGRDRDKFETSMVKINKRGQREDNLDNLRARLVALCLVDEDDKVLFPNDYDVKQLGEKSVAALQKVFNKCQEMNGMTDEDVEELAEGFDSAPDENSSSD